MEVETSVPPKAYRIIKGTIYFTNMEWDLKSPLPKY